MSREYWECGAAQFHQRVWQLRVWHRKKPWWGFGLVERWEETLLEAPEDVDYEDVKRLAERFREAGAGCRIETAP